MARVSSFDSTVHRFTGGLDQFELPAPTVRALLAALDARFPGLGTHVAERMTIAIDGEIHRDALAEPLAPDAEVALIPRIGAG